MAKETKENKEATEGKANEGRRPVAGDTVHLVTVRDGHLVVKVTRAQSDTVVDIKGVLGGQELVITSSKLDPAGQIPDSWHWPEE